MTPTDLPHYEKVYLTSFNSDFIAAGVQLDDQGKAYHAGIIIKLDSQLKIFHFSGTGIHFDDIAEEEDEWYFLRKLSIINPKITASFYNVCKKIMAGERPQYGLYFDGSFYDQDANYFSNNGQPNYTSCVGFCLSVIKGALYEQDFINYSDWDNVTNIEGDEYIDIFLQKVKTTYPDLDVDTFKQGIRRILPIEYFAAAYLIDTPVRKKDVDLIVTQIAPLLAKEID